MDHLDDDVDDELDAVDLDSTERARRRVTPRERPGRRRG